MVRRKEDTPLHKILMTKSKLGLFIQYGDAALGEQTAQEFMRDIQECLEYLMSFRNIINGMVSFDEPPQRAVLPYLENDED